MDAAIRALAAQSKKESFLYLKTAAKVGRGLITYGRWQDAVDLLVPLVQAGARRLDVARSHDELWDAYHSVAGVAIYALKLTGNDKEADRLRALSKGWPEKYDRSSPDFSIPTVTRKVDPVLTQSARANRVDEMVMLSIVVGADGRAHDIQVVKSLPYGLNWEAVRAVRQWRFKPAMFKGEAIPLAAQIEVNFRVLN